MLSGGGGGHHGGGHHGGGHHGGGGGWHGPGGWGYPYWGGGYYDPYWRPEVLVDPIYVYADVPQDCGGWHCQMHRDMCPCTCPYRQLTVTGGSLTNKQPGVSPVAGLGEFSQGMKLLGGLLLGIAAWYVATRVL